MSMEQVRFSEVCDRGEAELSAVLDAEWEASMPLPKLAQAEQYDRILRALGHETLEPIQVSEGWVVYWRPTGEWAEQDL